MKKKLLFIIFILLLISGIAIARIIANNNYRGYKISNGGSIIGIIYTGDTTASRNVTFADIKEHNICKKITSTNSNTVFIPTKTSTERSSFLLHKPSNVLSSDCGCVSDNDCSDPQICSGYVASVRTCAGTQTNNGSCRVGQNLGGNCTDEDGPCAAISSRAACDGVGICHINSLYTCEWAGTPCSGIKTGSVCSATAGCSINITKAAVMGTCVDQGGGSSGGGGTNCVNTYQPTCFIAGTQVILADGTIKSIEDIEFGEILLGENGISNIVKKTTKTFYSEDLYSINGSGYFVTAGHPFMTTEGWKSFDPEITKKEVPDLLVGKLTIGDVLVTNNGWVSLYTYTSKKDPQYVYNFVLDGDHTYYANNYLVHNKYAAPEGACGGVTSNFNNLYGICGCPEEFPYGSANYCYTTTCSDSVGVCDPCETTSQCPLNTSCKSQQIGSEKVCAPSATWYAINQPGTSYPNGYPLCAAQ